MSLGCHGLGTRPRTVLYGYSLLPDELSYIVNMGETRVARMRIRAGDGDFLDVAKLYFALCETPTINDLTIGRIFFILFFGTSVRGSLGRRWARERERIVFASKLRDKIAFSLSSSI